MSARAAHALLIVSLLGAGGCGLEGEIVDPLTDQGNVRLPEPRDTVLHGKAEAIAGGAITFFTAGGQRLMETDAVVGSDGQFAQAFPGTEEHRGLFLWGSAGDRVLVGLLPELPRQPTVFHDVHHIIAWQPPYGHGSLAELNAATTAVAFVLHEAGRLTGVTLDALGAGVIADGLDEVVDELGAPDGPVRRFALMVERIDAAAAGGTSGEPAFAHVGLDGDASFLSQAWIASAGVDYDGDGTDDTSTDAFDQALYEAAAGIELGVCYPDDVMRVIFQVDLRDGAVNRNCAAVDHYKWASFGADKRVFIAAGVHEDTPVCEGGRSEHCLSPSGVDEVNAQLGNWEPNLTAMYDDGTHGDAVGGDRVWTISFELPYWNADAAPDGAGLRLGYKYTFGSPGQGWTDSEEWPGNQRLLELVDLNGDHRIARFDIFGDEAANKDKVNLLKPSKGGCGTIDWEAERDPECAGDSRENRVDTDGDCDPDAWAPFGTVTPLTIDCE